MKNFNNGPIPHSCLLESNSEGLKVAILGGTHGNELVGVKVVEQLSESISLQAGQVLLGIGNPKAVEYSQRFVEHDINRLMNVLGLHAASIALEPSDEQLRALEIAGALSSFCPDILIDIHNTILPSAPFIYCENTPEHLCLTKYFGLAGAIYSPAHDYDEAVDGAVDNYVDSAGGIGLTYETGFLRDGSPQAVIDQVCKEIKALLVSFDLLEPDPKLLFEARPKDHFEIFTKLVAENDFTFAKPAKTGLRFAKGELIALDGEVEILAPEDCVVLFPKGQKVSAGQLACELARPKGQIRHHHQYLRFKS